MTENGGASVGYGLNYMTLTFDLTHDLDLRFFMVKFWNSCISEIVGLIDVKWKVNQLDAGLTTVHDLELWAHSWPWSLRVTVWNSLISGMGVLIYLVWKESKSSIHDHDIDLCVTMVAWMEVQDSDWGDFRRRRAVDISSFSMLSYFRFLPGWDI